MDRTDDQRGDSARSGVAERHRGDDGSADPDVEQEHRLGDVAMAHRRPSPPSRRMAPSGISAARPRMNSTMERARKVAASIEPASADVWPGCE